MPSVRHVKFAPLPVADQDRALAFYTAQLGLKVLVDAPGEGGWRWIELAAPGAKTRLLFTRGSGDAGETEESALVLVVDDVAGMVARLGAAGVEVTQPPRPAPWDPAETYAQIRDSEGNLVQLGDG